VPELTSYLDKLTKKQLIIAVTALALDKGVDVVTGGALNKMTKKVLLGVGSRLLYGPVRSIGGTGVGMTRLAFRNPYIAGATILYVGYHERERIKQLLDQGYDIIEERLPTPSLPTPGIPSPVIPGVEDIIIGGPAALIPRTPGIRVPSKFNKAVSAGMKAIRKDKSYGGKGQIKPSKKAFSVVVKLAAAKKKKKKAPKSGIRRRIWNAMKGLR
jgi:hypothetical protein